MRRWRVVGGRASGGLLVRQGPELSSAAYGDRLAYGAVVEEATIMAIRGCDRLQYRKLLGAGPASGWVSLLLGDQELLALLPHHLPQLEDQAAWVQETRYQEIARVRLILDAPCEQVAAAVAASLHGDLPRLAGDECLAAGELRWRTASGGFPLPAPVSEHWRGEAWSTTDFSEEAVWQGSVQNSEGVCSLGLRPLLPGESCSVKDGHLEVSVWDSKDSKTRVHSSIEVVEETCEAPTKSFHLQVSCVQIPDMLHGEFGALDDLGDALELNSLRCTCVVRPYHSGAAQTELMRQLCGGSLLMESAPGARPVGRPDFDHEPLALFCSQILYMLDLETRVWASANGFPLVELWRGIRRPFQWAVFSALNSAASHIFALGSAGESARERREGRLYDCRVAEELCSILPHYRNDVGKKHGQFTEGSVDVSSFADLLQRVIRRGAATRGFADLGSGRGHAVLTAHALFPFAKCIGFEIDSDAMEAAQLAWRGYMQSGLVMDAKSPANPLYLFETADFLQPAASSLWTSCSVVFANGVTWPSRLIACIARLALNLKKGAVLILVARRLPMDQEVLHAFDVRGDACLLSFTDKKAVQVWIYQRR